MTRSLIPHALVLVALGACAADADPVQSEVAITVPQRTTSVRTLIRSTNSSGRGTDTLELQTQIIYGLTAQSNLMLLAPAVRREQGGRDALGLGDVALLVKQRLWRRNSLQTQDRVSLIAGFKLPTGPTDLSDRFGTLPRRLQPGSGSFDFPVGILLAHDAPRGLFANLIYTLRTSADGYRFGNALRYDLAYAHALKGGRPREHFVWAVLELNGSLASHDEAGSTQVADTGGHLLYLSPGLRLVHWTGRFVLDLSYQIPIVRSLNGRQGSPEGSWLLGVRANF